MDIAELVNTELALLKTDIQSGDERLSNVLGNGKLIYYSKKTAIARIGFMDKIKQLLTAGDITTSEANLATQMFGKETTKMYWIK